MFYGTYIVQFDCIGDGGGRQGNLRPFYSPLAQIVRATS